MPSSSAIRPDALNALLRLKPSAPQDLPRLSSSSSSSLSLSLVHKEYNQELKLKRKRLDELETNPNPPSCSLSMACHEIIAYGEDDKHLYRKFARLNELGSRSYAGNLPVLDPMPKPIAQFDGKQVVKMVSATSKKYECVTCGQSFDTPQGLGGHRSSHYVEDENQGNHVCNVCSKSFPTGRALGGHKRRHYNGVLLKRKAAPATTSLMPVSQENSACKTYSCVRLFGVDIKKAQEDKDTNLALTL